MKGSRTSSKLIVYIVFLIGFLSIDHYSFSQSIGHAYGTYCVGSRNIFYYAGAGAVTNWYTNGTIMSGGGTSTSIEIIWNSATSNGFVQCNYSGPNGSGPVYLSPIVISSATTPSVSISANKNNICPGTSVTFTASPVNGGTAPYYSWYVSGSLITSGSSNTFSTSALTNGQQVSCTMSSNAPCVSTVASSNVITMSVSTPPQIGVTISGNTSVCQGSSTSFSASITNQTTGVSYQWKKNGINISSDNPNVPPYVLVLNSVSNNDVISCVATPTTGCGSPATSNSLTISITQPQTFSVSTGVSTLGYCPGATITFSANSSHPAYNYQWYMNGNAVPGATGATFSTTAVSVAQLQSVWVSAYTSASCVTNTYATGSAQYIPFTIYSAPTVSGNLNVISGSSTTLTANGNTPTYRWYDASGNQIYQGYQYTTSTSLTPGTYTFQVRGASVDGSCLTNPVPVTISVDYPTISYTPVYNSSTFTKTIDLSKPVGTVGGTAGTTPTGGVTYAIPIYAPPGTNGLQPSISVVYNSQGGDGNVGYGWNIGGMSVISRTGKSIYHNGITAPVNYTSDDAFVLDGMRLNPISGANGANGTVYATESENFSKIVSNSSASANNPDWFKVISKDGTVMEFGNSIDSRVLTDDGQNVVLWRLNKIIDVNGNYIEFKYNNAYRDSRIEEINYTGNTAAGLLPYDKIKFDYGIRNDKNVVYDAGASLASRALLTSITVKHDVEVVKTYQFNYGFDNVTSLLKEVIESGSDGSSLNSTIFLYGDPPQNNITTQSTVSLTGPFEYFAGDFDADGKTDLMAATYYYDSYNIKMHSDYQIFTNLTSSSPTILYSTTLPSGNAVEIADKKSYNFLTGDYNGDGRDDISLVKTGVEYIYPGGTRRTLNNVTINYTTSSGFTTDNIVTPTAFGQDYKFIHTKGNFYVPGDFDGDGNQDYILILARKRTEYDPDPDDYFDYKAFLTSTATNERNSEILNFGFGANPSPDFYAGTVAGADLVAPIDFDGDGKSEILVTKDGQSYILSINRIAPSSGYSFSCSVVATTTAIIKDCKLFPGDFNGDKKTDFLLRATDESWKILYSTGKSFVTMPFGFNQTVHMTGTYSDDKIIVADFNGDGRSDILHGFVNTSTTSKFSLYYSKGASGGFYYEQYDYAGILGFVDFSVGDFNGDGRSDLVNHLCVSCNTDYIAFKPQTQERLLKKITDGHNVTTAFEYKLLSDKSAPAFYNRTMSLDDPSNKTPFNYVQLPIYAVSALISPDGIGGTSTTSYTYENAVLHRSVRGFLGFRKITGKNLTSGTTTVVENDINTQFAVPYSTKQTTSLTATGELLNEMDITNSFTNLSTGYLDKRFFHKVDKILSIDNIKGSASEVLNTYDSYGNLTNVVTNVGSLSGSTVSAVESSTVTTNYGVHNTPVPAKPDQVTTTLSRTGAASQTSTTQFTYTANGLLSTQTDFYGLPKAVTTTFGYNGLGNVTSATVSASGVSNRVSNFTYDALGRFVLTKRLAPGSAVERTETFTYDGKWGQPLTTTSTDCLTTQYEYDAFGRLKKTTDPVFVTTSSLVWDVQGQTVYYSNIHYNGGKPDEKLWFDKLGRAIKKQVMGFNNQWLTELTTYNSKGNIATSTNQYYLTETPITTTNTYDAYGRLQTSASPLNTVTYSYNKLSGGSLQVTISDQAGQTTTKITDAAGRIISNNDKGGDLYFTYDSRGLQTEVKHSATILVTNTYDPYGRQTSVVDKNAGSVTYVYDALGQLTQQTDNTGHTYQMTYDELGRVITRQGPEGITNFEYYKDNATGCSNNNISKVTGFNGVVKEYTFDNLKRIQSEKLTVDGIDYTTRYSYDSWSNVSKITYPSGIEVNKTYDNTGQLNTVTGGSAGAQVTLFSGSQINGFGQYTSYVLGNNKTSQITYQNGFPTSYYAQGVQNLNFTWDYARGNLSSRQDALKGLTELFQYDALNRLTQTSVNGQVQLTMTYDGTSAFSMGNITSKTDAGNYTYKSDKVHAVAYITNPVAISNSTIGQTISYTPFLKAATITEDNNKQLAFTYGPDYERVKTQFSLNSVVAETKYFLGDYEKQVDNNGTREIHYVKGGDGLCAIIVRENGVNNFYVTYTDHLGSILTLTDLNGNIVTEQNFDAWGRRRNPSNWTYTAVPSVPVWLYRGFTGHEELPQFALINMNGRLYDPVQGRMLSPDNLVTDPLTSQGFNRYAYAHNNPLCYVDANGHFVWFIIAAAALIGGVANGIAYDNAGRNFFDGFWRGAVVGGAAAITGAAIAGALPGFGGAVLAGMGGGIVNGGLGSALNGGDIAQGIMFGAMTGVVGGGLGSYFGGGTGALIGGAAAGALGSALTGGNILLGAVVGGVSSFAMYHGMNYYMYSRSPLKTMGVRYVDFARMGGDYQRSLARHKEFGGIVTTEGYYRVPASERHNLGFAITNDWVDAGRIKGDILFTFHTHWAKAGILYITNDNGDILTDPAEKLAALSKGGLSKTVYGPSPDDTRSAGLLGWTGILSDRSGIYQYTGAGAPTVLNRTSLLRYNFIYWPW